MWTGSTVSKLLSNPTYLGCTAQGRTRKLSFKAGVREAVPRGEWTVMEGTHPALVDRETFAAAARRRKGRTGVGRFQNQLAGLVLCGDCGGAMVSAGTRRKDSPAVLVCRRYKRAGPAACGSHAIHYPALWSLLDGVLRRALILTAEERETLLSGLVRRALPEGGGEASAALKAELDRLGELEGELWESRLLGELEEERFHALLDRCRARRQTIVQKLETVPPPEGETALRAALAGALDRVLASPGEDPALLSALVERVTVGERQGDRPQPVTVELAAGPAGGEWVLERSGPMDHSLWRVLPPEPEG